MPCALAALLLDIGYRVARNPQTQKRSKSMTESKKEARRMVMVSELTDGILDPAKPMLGPVTSGGTIVGNTAPGCWGPMITPRIRGGHEVTVPVYLDGAAPGDAVVLRIRDINVTSFATASGHDRWVEGHFLGDPYAAPRCPNCGTLYPDTYVEGIGQQAVRCVKCNTPVTPFQIVNGYTVVFDETRQVGVTVPQEAAERIARSANQFAALPESSVQHSILTYAPHDLIGLTARLRPFLGQIGTTPGIRMPDSHNAGDFGSALVGAPHEYAITAEQLELRTDGHMDIDAVRPGAILLAPVKVPGAGIYFGDMHALQGDGEIAGHTMDVSGTVTLEVELLKGRPLEGPVLFPLLEDLPPLARPFNQAEKARAQRLAAKWGIENLEESAPISVIGSGPDLNKATEVGLRRAAELLSLTVPEVMNRATITGGIEIGRHPGVIQVTFLAPLSALEKASLLPFVEEQYGLV
jgi:formamidase